MKWFGEDIEDHNRKYILHYIDETPGLDINSFLNKNNLANKIEKIREINKRMETIFLTLKVKSNKNKKKN